MIERIEGLPDGVLGFRFSGEIGKRDYEEVLIPAVKEAIEGGRDVRCLCELGSDFDGYEMGAMWEDLKTGAHYGMGHLSAWKRMALVTDVDWIRHLTALFGWMTPGELKLFSTEEAEQARAWIVE